MLEFNNDSTFKREAFWNINTPSWKSTEHERYLVLFIDQVSPSGSISITFISVIGNLLKRMRIAWRDVRNLLSYNKRKDLFFEPSFTCQIQTNDRYPDYVKGSRNFFFFFFWSETKSCFLLFELLLDWKFELFFIEMLVWTHNRLNCKTLISLRSSMIVTLLFHRHTSVHLHLFAFIHSFHKLGRFSLSRICIACIHHVRLKWCHTRAHFGLPFEKWKRKFKLSFYLKFQSFVFFNI